MYSVEDDEKQDEVDGEDRSHEFYLILKLKLQ